MPRADYATCRECGRHRDEVGTLSRSRLCGDCAETRLRENIVGIHTKTGVPWARVKLGMARSLFGPEIAGALLNVGAFQTTPLDEAPKSP